MWDFFKRLFSSDFMPHGHCYFWAPSVLWLNVVSDILVAISYYSIPVTLVYFTRKRTDLPYRWVFVAFSAFIVACGTTHVMEVWTVWHGTYRLAGVIKAVTALLSVGTAILLVKLVPEALTLRSPLELARVNGELEREIAQRTQAAEAIRQAKDELAKTNAALQLEIAERKQIEQRLREVSRMKSEFLANMSHELRTPLNSIIGFSEVLIDGKAGPLAPTQAEFLTDVLTSGRHLLQLINDVLDLSKVEAGKMELHPAPFSTRQAIEEVCAVVAQLIRKKNLDLRTDIDPAADAVTLDQQKFKQMLYNLLSNAVKFSHPGGRLEISVAAQDDTHLRLQVRDYGIGIRAEDFGRLFVEFQQLDSGVGRRYEGTGLGLALTKKIVECQGGRISLESQLGEGSTFTVILPRVSPEVAA